MIWFDGSLRPGPAIDLDAGDRGLLLGDGVFETIGIFNRRPFALDAHVESLAAAGAVLGFAVPRDQVLAAVDALLGTMAGDHGALRVTVSRGAGPRGLLPPAEARPRVLASLAPWSPAVAFQPVTLATVALRRNETSPLSRLKTLAYLDPVLALTEARARGADDALMLNTRGRVAGSSMANLFALVGGQLVTPPVTDGVRPGIMRALAIEEFGAVERSLDPADLAGAPLFLTNSLRLLLPVTALDGDARPPLPATYAARFRLRCGLPG
ncbi:aminotransferase class IV [Zavarzinia compransoris]|uniref:Probable branched-chain-amino-acid aminotransferase n=1 Tax=Zavarzinia compransoris TaxID=1264899 RepID=A0A317DVI1_9PROT|nr:aminotransferase class IV [Zavarzinia compransoris]PWR18689.1 class IV aminotransferase [Zavarzinia compransoris]TDP48665.1 branched-chain amino acid aminotransferase [Zavarzinia compransoris]